MGALRDTYLVVMAGGSGTRFWPKSTPKRPKQFLSFESSGKTLLEKTLDRFESLVSSSQQWVVTTKSHEPTVNELLKGKIKILSEPEGRNTAPCIFWAAKEIEKLNPQAVMMVMPSDHLIQNEAAFIETVKMALDGLESHGGLCTLGIKPTRAETGFGYLKLGQELSTGGYKVDEFKEKPDLQTAKSYVSSGSYLWNGGMFLWKVQDVLKAFDDYLPELSQIWSQMDADVTQAYPKFPSISIDYAIMEKAKDQVMTYVLDCGWDDLGNWTSLENLTDSLCRKVDGGVVLEGNVLALNSKGNIIDAKGKTVALLGVEDLIIVQSGDSILVAHKDCAQDIRKITEKVNKSNA